MGAHVLIRLASLEGNGRSLTLYVQREFEGFLSCGRLKHGFAAKTTSMSGLLLLVESAEIFAPVVGLGEWLRVRLYWLTKFYRKSLCDNGH